MNETLTTAGAKVKSIREIKSISLETLAGRTGLSIEQLETIESGNSLSLSPLIKIARALGVRLGTFLDDVESDDPVVCHKNEQYKGVRFISTKDTQNHLGYYSLARKKAGRYMEPFFIEINNSEDDDFKFSSHEGEEFLYCLEGSVEIAYGQKHYTLEQGDSIYYDSIVDHGIKSVMGAAKILAVIYAPA
ncbi:MAG: XRE family transcriptional regulator [Prevotellaceae bacterium]|jgi:transcriptional regulator with XRE-family HTH domain|nr:XRE family transcriptional regulator [Prevotellaceae bacterium]